MSTRAGTVSSLPHGMYDTVPLHCGGGSSVDGGDGFEGVAERMAVVVIYT